MADHNPLEPSPERDQRIRERAYALWEEEGKPHGRHDEYWERASELVGMEESAGSGQIAVSDATDDVVDEAELQENLGEFPSQFTDQGEKSPTPAAKRKRAPVKAKTGKK